VLSTVSYAQQAPPSGEEVFAHIGCRNCHGKAGEGDSGPVIARTRLSLRKFVGYVRMPSKEMPPYAPLWASDAELTIVYHLLDGIDAVRIPPAIMMDLKSSPQVRVDGQANAEVEIEMTVLRPETTLQSDVPHLASLRYRVTLITNANTPVGNQTLEYRLAGLEEWSKFTTDEHGEALLGQDRAFIVAHSREPEKTRAQLRMPLPAGRMALVIEALDYTEPAKPVVVGIGTTSLKGQ
jgi:hypothetical protein